MVEVGNDLVWMILDHLGPISSRVLFFSPQAGGVVAKGTVNIR
jgi:hypothetical protein